MKRRRAFCLKLASARSRFFNCLGVAGTLGICLTAQAAPPFLTLTNSVSGPRLTIQSDLGITNQILYSAALYPSNWVALTNLFVTQSPYGFTDSSATSAARRFYRVLAFPTNNPPPLNMALIPAGAFTMGDTFNEGYSEELPTHTVSVSAFYMDKYEVTKALWDEVYQWAITNGYSFRTNALGKATTHPAQTLNWYDAVKWCNARSEKEGRVSAYYTSAAQTNVYRAGETNVDSGWVKWAAGYRLPTEAEWEKAARGGAAGHRFPWTIVETIDQSRANYYSLWDGEPPAPFFTFDVNATGGFVLAFNDGVFPYTSPVGSFAANGYGLYDLAGNVWEWCWDWWNATYYSTSPATDPRGPASGSYRVQRGGDWSEYGVADGCRSAARDSDLPQNKSDVVGFRCVLPQSSP